MCPECALTATVAMSTWTRATATPTGGEWLKYSSNFRRWVPHLRLCRVTCDFTFYRPDNTLTGTEASRLPFQ